MLCDCMYLNSSPQPLNRPSALDQKIKQNDDYDYSGSTHGELYMTLSLYLLRNIFLTSVMYFWIHLNFLETFMHEPIMFKKQ